MSGYRNTRTLSAEQEAARVRGGVGGGRFGKSAAKRVAESSVFNDFPRDAGELPDDELEASRNSAAAGVDPTLPQPEFMTPSEILARFSPLDNDRLYWYENGRGSTDHEENDEQFWSRKTRETRTNTRRDRFPTGIGEIPPAPSEAAPGFANPSWTSSYPTPEHATLYDDIAANGVLSPISLQRNLGSIGSAGKPEILRGLHRVAVMAAAHPDTPIPVVFFDTLQDAKDHLGNAL